MTKKNNAKKVLLSSVLSLVLCIAMLIGTTFAWFTDTAVSNNNIIKSGTLDAGLLYADGTKEPSTAEYKDAEQGAIFNYDNWEPGYVDVKHVKIANKGTLAFKYVINIIANGEVGKLAEVIDVYYFDSAKQITRRAELTDENKLGTLADVLATMADSASGTLEAKEEAIVTIALKMQETAGNDYQGLSIGTDFSVRLMATQLTSEEDSFDELYDEDAEFPAWTGGIDTTWYNTEDTEFTLDSVEDLAGLAAIVNGTAASTYSLRSTTVQDSFNGKTIKLAKDIDLGGLSWVPIGNSTYKFQGNFDGQGYTVSNLYIQTPKTSNVGLFGFTTTGTIKNLTIENVNIAGRLNVGAVAGTPYTTTYKNITVNGDVKISGMAYVGGAFGKNVYADLTNITIDANEGSYVNADSVENGTTYRTYVGGVIGFMGEGEHTVSDVTSNIDVIGSTCDVGGITGIAHYGNSFVDCSSSGDVTITDLDEGEGSLEIGGIAGVWHNQTGQKVTFENCSYTGTLTSPGVTAFPNDGLVGKAYGSGKGTLILNGKTFEMVDADAVAKLEEGENVTLTTNTTIKASDTSANSGYGETGVSVKGGVFDGNGNTLTVNNANGTWDCAIHTTGGTIKNVKAAGAFRGIFMGGATADVYIDNVSFDTIYTFNSDAGNKEYGVYISNSTMNGWTSYSNVHKEVVFTNCEFTEGNGYAFLRAYNTTNFVNCYFDAEAEFGLQVMSGAVATFENCYYGDTLITSGNIAEIGLLYNTDASLVTVK